MKNKSSEEFGWFAKITLVIYLLLTLSIKSRKILILLPPELRKTIEFLLFVYNNLY